MSTDVSEEHIASTFRVEEYAEQETSVKAGGKHSREKEPQVMKPIMATEQFGAEEDRNLVHSSVKHVEISSPTLQHIEAPKTTLRHRDTITFTAA
jgi:hypothetical protein